MRRLSIATKTCVVLSLLLLAVSFSLYLANNYYFSQSKSALGRVISLDVTPRSDGFFYAPEVEFFTPSGQPVHFISDIVGNPPAYVVGDAVNVYYQENNPELAIIDDFYAIWGNTLLACVSAAIFLLLSFLGHLSLKMKHAQFELKTRHDEFCKRRIQTV